MLETYPNVNTLCTIFNFIKALKLNNMTTKAMIVTQIALLRSAHALIDEIFSDR